MSHNDLKKSGSSAESGTNPQHSCPLDRNPPPEALIPKSCDRFKFESIAAAGTAEAIQAHRLTESPTEPVPPPKHETLLDASRRGRPSINSVLFNILLNSPIPLTASDVSLNSGQSLRVVSAKLSILYKKNIICYKTSVPLQSKDPKNN